MGKYNIGEVWWTQFPFEEIEESKRRPAIVIDDEQIAILSLMVTSKNKDNPYCIEIKGWKEAGLSVPSWARIDRIIKMDEWRMERKIGDLLEEDLSKILQLVVEFMKDVKHKFSLIAIQDTEGRFLQSYDERWNCWLFPYFKTLDSNKENIDREVSILLQQDVSTKYIARTTHCKYSVSDEVYKIYEHMLYGVVLDEIPEHMVGELFELGEKTYSWKRMKDLELDRNVMDKNDDVIAFVKNRCL